MNQDKIIVGAISGAFGVHGEVRLKSYCADPAAIADYTPLSTESGQVFTSIILTGQVTNALIARVDGISTKEQADALKGQSLFADRSRLPAPEDEEYYHADLIGLSVFDAGGTALGTVKSVQNHGAADLLEVQIPDSSATVFLPFTKAAVPLVDLSSKRIVADPPDGLF
ncbi:ribosome maturation factor RimM [Flavimaricola marinus]|uniref:Ribosome maturation factor RimM n=1 Tax=Flavimaricola marinus TaxID=1819565 RepID=A0A238L946_9RHOB|nr:ribosome maturation factor RimM [Flavimaricola marinus]SMY06227.1 Ribosome maturation factor RimM [Flavimaricola marinus]